MESKSISLNNIRKERMNPNSRVDFWDIENFSTGFSYSERSSSNITTQSMEKIYNCKIIGFEEDSHRIPGIDIKLKNHTTWEFGNETVKIEHAPGHTAGHVFYHFQRNKLVFVGDIVFPMGCGRIFEGSAKEMYESVIKIKNLSNDTKIYSGHEYTNSNSKFCLEFDKSNKELSKRSQNILSLREENKPTVPTTVQLEKETNIFFRCDNQDVKNYINMKNAKSEEVFAKLRELKDNF